MALDNCNADGDPGKKGGALQALNGHDFVCSRSAGSICSLR